MMLYCSEMKSPVGRLRLVADESALVAILLEGEKPGRIKLAEAVQAADHPVLRAAEEQLREYFAGQRRTFDLPLHPEGTGFQQRVWRYLRGIPFGQCRSYGELARAIGQPTASRAVGAACGKNPLAIVVPCHRVIGQNGKLTGFAGGLEIKAELLAMEKEAEAAEISAAAV